MKSRPLSEGTPWSCPDCQEQLLPSGICPYCWDEEDTRQSRRARRKANARKMKVDGAGLRDIVLRRRFQ